VVAIGKIKSLLTKKIIILDGAFGTELQKKGLPGGACPENGVWTIRKLSRICMHLIKKQVRK